MATKRSGNDEAVPQARAALFANAGLQGRAFCEAYTALVDDWLRSLFGDEGGAVLVAVGGYGRRELAPGSDLDLVLLHERKRDVAALADAVWYPIWNAGFRLDHSVRTVKEALSVADGDLKAALGLLDARGVAGDERLVNELRDRTRTQWRSRASRWLPALDEATRSRHDTYDAIAFTVEPDLKDGAGGLRDVNVLRALVDALPVTTVDPAVEAANDVLLDLRVALQRRSGDRGDRLLLEYQDDVARALEWGDGDDVMRRVASTGRTIAWHLDDAWRAVRSVIAGPKGRSRAGGDVPLATGVVSRDGEVAITGDASFATDPSLLLRVADVAARDDLPIARTTLVRLAAEAPVFSDPWPDDARDLLVGLLGAGPATRDVFETLDQYELLTRVLPEWDAVRSRPQRNAFHRYTVDRHLVEAAVQASALTRRVSRPDLLLVGAWLHDLGKGFAGDHTAAGVLQMERVARRMGYPDDDVAVLVALVQHHLLFPSVATSRDLDDSATISWMRQRVESIEVVDLLHALTEADSLATGETAWSAWKAGLVGTLVDRMHRALGGEEHVDLPTPSEADTALARRANGQLLVDGGEHHLAVAAPDHVGLFSNVVGVLGLHGASVRAARARSAPDGTGISEFEFETAARAPEWHAFEADLRRALDGQLELDRRLQERAAVYRRLHRPTAAVAPDTLVLLDNDVSDVATVVEVRTSDHLGVLYAITHALADAQLDIRHAKVSTLGHEVVDTFYVVDADGAKLTATARLAALEASICAALAQVQTAG